VIRNLWGRVEKLVFSIPKKEVEGVEAGTTILKSWMISKKYGFDFHHM
jgi:hypothetical protein